LLTLFILPGLLTLLLREPAHERKHANGVHASVRRQPHVES
jgi:hypothetical protein